MNCQIGLAQPLRRRRASGVSPNQVRNIDITHELKALAANVNFEWITNVTRQLGQFQNGMRRNVLRPLALDALALSLER